MAARIAAVAFPETIETERLCLHRFTRNDFAAVRDIWADPEVQSSLRPGETVDPDQTASQTIQRRVANWERDGFGLMLIRERGSSEAIGWSGPWLQDLSLAHTGEVEIGWTLRSHWWGKGYATEAAIASADAVFEHLTIPRFISLIHPSNDRSLAVAKRLGMTHDGVAEHKDRIDLELLVYSMLRTDWVRTPSAS